MKRSQIAVVSALAVILITTLAWLVGTRVVIRLIYHGIVREESVTRAGAASIERRQ